jgi:hypothetical protein
MFLAVIALTSASLISHGRPGWSLQRQKLIANTKPRGVTPGFLHTGFFARLEGFRQQFLLFKGRVPITV